MFDAKKRKELKADFQSAVIENGIYVSYALGIGVPAVFGTAACAAAFDGSAYGTPLMFGVVIASTGYMLAGAYGFHSVIDFATGLSDRNRARILRSNTPV